MKSQSHTPSAPTPTRANERPRKTGLALLILLLLLFLTAGGGGAWWWLNHGKPSDTSPDDPTHNKIPDPTQKAACSDDDDPKYLEPLEFGEPISVRFNPRPLRGLAKTPLPEVEVYPWQPEGLVAILGEHRMRGRMFALSRDRKTVAVTGGDAYIRFGSLDTLHENHILQVPAGVVALAWSPADDRLAVIAGTMGVLLFDVSDPAKVPAPVALEKPAPQLTSLSWSGDGKYLIAGDNNPGRGIAYVWDVEKRKIIQRLTHEGSVSSVAFSPVRGDYRALTSGGPKDGSIYLWDAVKSDKELAIIDFRPVKTDSTTFVGHVAFSPDGKRALSCHPDRCVRVWDLDLKRFKKDKVLHTLAGHAEVPLAEFSPDGKSIVSSRASGAGVWLWNAESGKQVRQLATSAGVYSLGFVDDERIIFGGTISNDNNIHIHDTKTGKEHLPPIGHLAAVTKVAVSPDGRTVVSGSQDQTVRSWNLAPDSADATVARPRHTLSAGYVGGLGFHPDSKHMFYHGSASPLALIDVESAKNVAPAFKSGAGAVVSADFTRDGRYALTGGADGAVRMWRMGDGMQVRLFNHDGQAGVAIAPDMRRAVRVGGTKTRLLHLRCQTTLREWDPVRWAPFLPDGRAVFLGGATSPTWKISADKVEAGPAFNVTLTGASAIGLSADGKHVAAVVGGRVAVFEASGKQRWTWTPPAPFYGVHAVALSAEGGWLVTANGDGTAYIIQMP